MPRAARNSAFEEPSPDTPLLPEPPIRRSLDGERLIAVLASLVEPLGRSFPASAEVVLHDLSLLPNSIVAVHGDITGRRPGDPATELLLEMAASGRFPDHLVGYETLLPDGRRTRSSTMIIRDVSGSPVAALCVNNDISAWMTIGRLARMMSGEAPAEPAGSAAPEFPEGSAGEPLGQAEEVPEVSPERFVRNVDELATHLLAQAKSRVGVSVELMKKEHKIQIVRDLQDRGMFMLRDAVDVVAAELAVSRYTIYNYLREISA